tara:strand:- start:3434 stop:3727 length:294 start_codon:yes stop_codon:yes gene_type:complete
MSHLLNALEISELKTNLSEWEFCESSIQRKFDFKTFIEAFSFMTNIALFAESINHHPNWNNVYSTVRIELITHDLGGLSSLDSQLALYIDKLYETFQ